MRTILFEPGHGYQAVITFVTESDYPVAAQEVVKATGLSQDTCRVYLARAAREHRLRRVSPGRYTGVDKGKP